MEFPEPRLNFLVIGDWGRRGTNMQKQLAYQMGQIGARVGNNFVISTGDNFYEDGVQSIHDAHWEESFNQVYTAGPLNTSWYAVLGNHDYRGNIEAQIEYSDRDPRWEMPARYYSFTRSIDSDHELLLVFLDTVPFIREYRRPKSPEFTPAAGTGDVEQQTDWLEKVLARSTADWRVVVGHHPIYSTGCMHGDSPELLYHIDPILHRYGVQVFLSGHEHDLQHIYAGGPTHYLVSGAGSIARDGRPTPTCRFREGRIGFLACSVGGTDLNLSFVSADGSVRYGATIDRADHEACEPAEVRTTVGSCS